MDNNQYEEEGQSINPTDEPDTSVDTSEEDEGGNDEATELKSRLAELEAEKEKLLKANEGLAARTKSAERKAKNKRTDLQTPDVPSSESVDERILKSQGMSEELLKELKRVARFNETDLITAQSDQMFVAIKSRIEQEQRDQEAALGASRGSGAGKPQKDFVTPGLKSDDHRKMWKAALKH